MKVIGAGFGRTGTLSLAKALDQLGLGPTLHNSKFIDLTDPIQMPWHLKANGRRIPWDALLQGYYSAVDWPAVYYWRELAAEYPDAKVILTVRPVREWLASFKRTIMPKIISQIGSERFQNCCTRLTVGLRTFNDDFSDENLMRVYARHVVDVKAFDPARLLIFSVKEGWEPLCAFLGAGVPSTPFPSVNDHNEFERERRRSA